MTSTTETTTQDDLPTVWQAFGAAKAEISPVGKTSVNEQQHFNFRGVDAVVNAAAQALNRHGVILVPVLEKARYGTVEVGQKRTLMANVRVKVRYEITGPRGDHFDVVVPGEAMDSGDKGIAKAMSVAYRIALIQALNLPTGDPEVDATSYERSPRRESAGDAFDNAAPAPPRGRQQQRPAPARVVLPEDDSWRDKIAGLATGDEANAAWAEIIELRTDGTLNDARAEQLKGAIRYHMAVRSQPQQPPQDDPWQTPAAPAAGNGQPPAAQPPRIRPEDQGAKKPAPPAGQDDDNWVTAWSDRLSKAAPDDLGGLQRDIGAAVMAKTITSTTAQDLSNLLREHRKVLNAA